MTKKRIKKSRKKSYLKRASRRKSRHTYRRKDKRKIKKTKKKNKRGGAHLPKEGTSKVDVEEETGIITLPEEGSGKVDVEEEETGIPTDDESWDLIRKSLPPLDYSTQYNIDGYSFSDDLRKVILHALLKSITDKDKVFTLFINNYSPQNKSSSSIYYDGLRSIDIISKSHGSLADTSISRDVNLEYTNTEETFSLIRRNIEKLYMQLIDEKSMNHYYNEYISSIPEDLIYYSEIKKEIEKLEGTALSEKAEYIELTRLLSLMNLFFQVPDGVNVWTFSKNMGAMRQNVRILTHLKEALIQGGDEAIDELMGRISDKNQTEESLKPCKTPYIDQRNPGEVEPCEPMKHEPNSLLTNIQLDYYNGEGRDIGERYKEETFLTGFDADENIEKDFGFYIKFNGVGMKNEFYFIPVTRPPENDTISLEILLMNFKNLFPHNEINLYLYNCLGQLSGSGEEKLRKLNTIINKLNEIKKSGMPVDHQIENFKDYIETLKSKAEYSELFHHLPYLPLIGEEIEIFGLKSKPEFNGKKGQIIGINQGGRYIVKIAGVSDQTPALKLENLRLFPREIAELRASIRRRDDAMRQSDDY